MPSRFVGVAKEFSQAVHETLLSQLSTTIYRYHSRTGFWDVGTGARPWLSLVESGTVVGTELVVSDLGTSSCSYPSQLARV